MKNVSLLTIALFAFGFTTQAQTTVTTTVKSQPGTTIDFDKKQVVRTEDKVLTTTTSETVKTEVAAKPKVYKKTKKTKYKSKFANGHDNRTRSKHYNTPGHDNRKKSKNHR
jgi:hypothetical protein